MTKTEELLAVLDLSEDEQDRWCCLNTNRRPHEHLADLAFRLRNKVIAMEDGLALWETAMMEVGHKKDISYKVYLTWCHAQARPIDWIIAALLVIKGLVK